MLDKASDSKNRARHAASAAVIEMAEKAEEFVGGDADLSDYKRAAARSARDGVFSSTDDARRGYDRAQGGANGAVELVVALVVGGLMAAFLLPIAIDEIVGVDTTEWTSGAEAMWEILPVMIVLAIFLFFVGVALKRSGHV